MQITFNTPFGFSPASTPEETKRANSILREVAFRLNGETSGARAALSRSGRCLFTFDLPALFCVDSTPVQDGAALKALMDGLIALNTAYLMSARVPDLYDSGVTYARTDIWDTIPALYAHKYSDCYNPPFYGKQYGDCKSLTAAMVAQYRKKGVECSPVFRWLKTPLGTKDYHILVLTAKGFEDPSKVLGMGRDENARM